MNVNLLAQAEFSYVASGATRILAIDDDPILREFSTVYLATPTTEIDTAKSAEAGLSMLAETDYDLLLIDIEMPGMDGIAMVRQIRSTPEGAYIPIVMVTGCDDVVSIDRACAAGANSFVTKPVNWRLLSYHLCFVLRAAGCTKSTGSGKPAPAKSPALALGSAEV